MLRKIQDKKSLCCTNAKLKGTKWNIKRRRNVCSHDPKALVENLYKDLCGGCEVTIKKKKKSIFYVQEEENKYPCECQTGGFSNWIFILHQQDQCYSSSMWVWSECDALITKRHKSEYFRSSCITKICLLLLWDAEKTSHKDEGLTLLPGNKTWRKAAASGGSIRLLDTNLLHAQPEEVLQRFRVVSSVVLLQVLRLAQTLLFILLLHQRKLSLEFVTFYSIE